MGLRVKVTAYQFDRGMYLIQNISIASQTDPCDQSTDVEMVMLDLELGKLSLSIGRSNEKRAGRYPAEVGHVQKLSMHLYLMYVISVLYLCHSGLQI